MSSESNPNTYRPFSLGMLEGNFTDPYAGMASWSYNNPAAYSNPNNPVMFGGNYTNPTTGLVAWSPAMENPNMLWADTAQINPTANPGLGAKLRDINSQYGSTIMGGLQAAGGLWGAYNGMQQNKLIKQQMANSLNQWNKNYANQVASYNTRLEDRHRAIVSAQGGSEADVEAYMAKNRLK